MSIKIKTCQHCQHFNLKMEREIVKKKKNPLLSGCNFWKERTSVMDYLKKRVR